MAQNTDFNKNASQSLGSCKSATYVQGVEPFTPTAKAIHCNVSGDYRVYFSDDDGYVVLSLVSGVTYPYQVKRVTKSSGVKCGLGGESTVADIVIMN